MKYFFLYLICLIPLQANAESILDLAKEILISNQTSKDYLKKKEILEKFDDIKEYIQTDFKNGNKNAHVDIYLLLDGMINNNLSSLQSFLAKSNNTLFANEFSQYMNYEYAEKLAYALKENKQLLTTEFNFVNSIPNVDCENYVNGNKINNNKTFSGPAGIPFYVGTYCSNNEFSIMQIQSESAQDKYSIHFQNYQPIHENIFKNLNIINKNNAVQKEKSLEINSEKINNLPYSLKKQSPIHLELDIGIRSYFNELKTQNVSSFENTMGNLIYISPTFQYNYWTIGFDIAPISQYFINSNNSIKSENNSNDGAFLQLKFGIKKNIWQINPKLFLTINPMLSVYALHYFNNVNNSNLIPGLAIDTNLNATRNDILNIKYGLRFDLNFINEKTDVSLDFHVGLDLNI